MQDTWSVGDLYEQYVGRWSRGVATQFLEWISPPTGAAWADIGCGTGALTERILAIYEPASIAAIDRSTGFVSVATHRISDPRVHFETGDATALPWDPDTFDVSVSGLVLNFIPDPLAMASEMARVTKSGGIVALYVWDYARGMQMMRHFWDAVVAVRPQDIQFDEGKRFPICQPQPLSSLFREAGLNAVTVRAIETPTVFSSFNDYWTPFLGNQGPAPTYLASVDNDVQGRIRESLRAQLPTCQDGSIELTARAWAVRGIV